MAPLLLNAYCTHRDPPKLDFPHQLMNRRDMSDPELAEHLDGFMGFIMQGGEREMTQSLYHVYRHIQRVQHHLSLNVEQEQLNDFAAWAWSANAIIFLEDGTVRDPSGNTLVDPDDGEAEEIARVPYPRDAIERKLRHDKALIEHGIQIYEGLPPVVGETEVVLRSPAEVARRAMSLFACALRAESLATNEELSVEDIRERMPLAFESFSPSETEFMNTAQPDQQAVINHAWRYEGVFVLQWALGFFDKLHYPAKICDVPQVARAMFDNQGEEMVEQATLRATSEILDELDRHFRMHWYARQAERNEEISTDLEIGVIQERRVALNWLTSFENADWDDVDCPT